jgi:hypothetical protein
MKVVALLKHGETRVLCRLFVTVLVVKLALCGRKIGKGLTVTYGCPESLDIPEVVVHRSNSLDELEVSKSDRLFVSCCSFFTVGPISV